MQQSINFFPKKNTALVLPGPAGVLEVVTTWPQENKNRVGVICHPHPLHQGTMQNKVVTALAKAFDQLELATVRFNFRGVGKSSGEYGHTIGEADDLRSILKWVKQVLPEHAIWLAGFSFGSYIAAMVANETQISQLVTIAPVVTHNDFMKLSHIRCPWLVIQGDQDEVIAFEAVKLWAKHPPAPIKFIVMSGAGHFFHGRLLELREILVRELSW